jgi:hypothetical protein
MGSWGVIQLTWLHYRPINTTPKAIKNSSNIITTHHCITLAFSKYTPPSVLSGTFGAHRGAAVKLFPGHTYIRYRGRINYGVITRFIQFKWIQQKQNMSLCPNIESQSYSNGKPVNDFPVIIIILLLFHYMILLLLSISPGFYSFSII